MSVVYSYIKR